MLGEDVVSAFASAGSTLAQSVRSLLGPGLLKAWLKFATGVVAVTTSERSAGKKVLSGLVVGFDASTSCVSAANVDGTCTNARVPERSVTGSTCSPRASAACSEPTAWKVVSALPIRSVSASERAPIVVTALAVSTRKLVNTGWSRISSEKRWSVADSAAGVYSIEVPAAAAEPAYCSANPLITCCRPTRVFGLSVLNSWSRSTTSRVAEAGSVEPGGSAGALLGPGVRAI